VTVTPPTLGLKKIKKKDEKNKKEINEKNSTFILYGDCVFAKTFVSNDFLMHYCKC